MLIGIKRDGAPVLALKDNVRSTSSVSITHPTYKMHFSIVTWRIRHFRNTRKKPSNINKEQ